MCEYWLYPALNTSARLRAMEYKALQTDLLKALRANRGQHDPSVQATSAEWKTASAFNLSNDELGKMILYIHVEDLVKNGEGTARLIRTAV